MIDLKSSSAHPAISAQSDSGRRRIICLRFGSFFELPAGFAASISVDAAAVDYRLGVLAAAEYDEQVGYHLSLALLVEFHDTVV